MATSQWRTFIYVVSMGLCGFSFAAHSALDDKPPFYQVQWQGKTAYIMGSMHLGRADFYPLPKPIQTALVEAKGLVVEVDVNKVDSRALLRKYAQADKSKGLDWQSRSPQTQTVMATYCQDKAAICQSLQAYAPWLQAMQISLFRYAALGYSTDFGIDNHLIGKFADKPIYELETVESQFNLLASFNSQVQWSMVTDAITADDSELLELVTAWRTGDEAALDNMMQSQMGGEGSELLDKILWQRNQVMADGLTALLASNDVDSPLFMVVGAGHVVGDRSVPQLLKQAGAKITPCWSASCTINGSF